MCDNKLPEVTDDDFPFGALAPVVTVTPAPVQVVVTHMTGKRTGKGIPRRKAADCPETCWGPEAHKHSVKCRKSRPLCRWRRKAVRGTCTCPAYHHPHAPEQGRCGDDAAYWAYLNTPVRKAG